jgi:hypothetical protein
MEIYLDLVDADDEAISAFRPALLTIQCIRALLGVHVVEITGSGARKTRQLLSCSNHK